MKFQFRSQYFMAFLVVLTAEILIATFFSQGFIRHTFGDFLVVILLYCLLRSILEISVINTAIAVLIISFGIEFLQIFKLMNLLNIGHQSIISLVLGSTFSFQDLIAYASGILTVLFVELKILKN